jgi:hypothetical protein
MLIKINRFRFAWMGALLLACALAFAVDFDADLLEDGWEGQYGFSTTGYASANMVGWWQLDNSTYGDMRDRTAHALHGTFSNLPGSPFVTGLFNTALSFDGDSQVSVSTSSPLNLSSAFTFSCWFKGSSASAATKIVHWIGSNGCKWEVQVTTAGEARLVFTDGSSNVTTIGEILANSAQNVRDGNWHHIAMTYGSGTGKVYVDGIEEDSASVTGWTFSSASSFGFGAASTEPFLLDEVRLYNIAVSGADISKLPNTYEDGDADGLSNYDEQAAGTDPTVADTDGDGTNDGSDAAPLDYYNGTLPTLVKISGDAQSGLPGAFLDNPLVLEVRDAGSSPLENAPVTLTVTSGTAVISETDDGEGLGDELDLRTDSNGRVTVYVRSSTALGAFGVEAKAVSGVSQTTQTFTGTTALPSSALALWLKADTGITMDGSNYVSNWADQSAEGNDAAQASSGLKPLFVSSGPNGKPCLRFDGSNDYLSAGSDSSLNFSNVTLFVVGSFESPTQNNMTLLSKDEGGGNTNKWIYWYNDGRMNFHFNPSGSHVLSTLFPREPGRLFLLDMVRNGTAFSHFKDGAAFGTATNSNSSPTVSSDLRLGQAEGNFYLNGNISEVVLYTAALSQAERESVEIYLADKYESYHPLATWILDYDEDVRDEIHAQHWSKQQADDYVTLLGTDPVAPVSGLRLWLDAGQGVTADGSGYVSAWADQSPNGNNAAQSSSGSRPQKITGAINGEPALRFDGSNDFLTVGNIASLTNPNFTYVVVGAFNSTSGDMAFLSRDEGGGNTNKWIYWYNSTAMKLHLNPGNANIASAAFTRSSGVYRTFMLTKNSTSYVHYLDGISGGTVTNSTTLPSPDTDFRIGQAESNFYLNGDIAEILVYDHALSAVERHEVEAYLEAKYGYVFDSDQDGMPNLWETENGFDPDDAADASQDADGDGLSNLQEYLLETDPFEADINGDGLNDLVSVQLGIDPFETDVDGDGISNADEIEAGTSPFAADTDRDGHDDDEDDYPLDPTRWEAPASDPGDTTGPTITLIQPAGATLIP